MTAAWLVVNGDDAGLDAGTDRALLEAGERGVLRSLSVIAGGPTAPTVVRAAARLGLGFGLHFNLTEGKPLTSPRTLVDSSGRFPPKSWWWDPASWAIVDPEEVAAEAVAQWETLGSLGVDLDHLDGHNHVHAVPPVGEGLCAALGDRSLFVRQPVEPECPDRDRPALPEGCWRDPSPRSPTWQAPARFVGFRFTHDPTRKGVEHLARVSPGVTEWMVHPGRRPGSPFTDDARRDREASTLCDPDLRQWLHSCGYRLGTFGEARCAS